MALDGEGAEARFGIWVTWASRWFVWKLADGSMENVDADALKRWNDLGSQWAHAKLADVLVKARGPGADRDDSVYANIYDDQVTACRFLGFARNPADRKLLEKLFQKQERHWWRRPELRKAADWALMMLDSVDAEMGAGKGGLSRVGSVNVQIQFPRKPADGEGKLRYYVFPERVKPNWWREATPVFQARASADFQLYGDAGDRKDLKIPGLKPGRYWVKVIWDRRPEVLEAEARQAEFVRRLSGHDKNTTEPAARSWDFESAGAQVFEIEAGKAIEVKIACDRPGEPSKPQRP